MRHRSASLLSAVALVALAGCTGGMHGWTTSDFEGRVLPVSSADGARRLELERGYDRTIAGFLRSEGPASDAVVTFQRPVLNATSACTVERPIPDRLLNRFSPGDSASVRTLRNAAAK